ncbi:MAG TPA: hypothetical protein VFJ58_15130 [Armatimonadota bacterium]|nr:hypothetical protein [Armatimonadota bacterium]
MKTGLGILLLRLRQILLAVAVIAIYLGIGAAWKVWMVVRHPPAGKSIDQAIETALKPYSSLPVGYVLGPNFGRVAAAIRLAGQATDSNGAAAREAARLDRAVIRSGGSWADVAGLGLAEIEQRPGRGSESQAFFIYLDPQRWGRTSEPFNPDTWKAADRYRQIAADYPQSPAAADALNRLADLDEGQWEFHDSRICRLTAMLLQPARPQGLSALRAQTEKEDPAASSAATAYDLYLAARPVDRASLSGPLYELASKADDLPLARWLKPGAAAIPGSGSEVIRLLWKNRPLSGTPVAMLDASRLRAAMAASSYLSKRVGQKGEVSPGDLEGAVEQLNPARADDPFRPGALALISPPMAAHVAEGLPVHRTGADGAARFDQNPASLAGVALLITPPAGAGDLSFVAPGELDNPMDFRFAPRIQLRTARIRTGDPPLLRWVTYHGAAQYLVAVALEPPAIGASQSTALSPDWDKNVTWWRDGIRGNSVVMDPARFVGPPTDLSRNGLWAGEIYRIIVVAEDASGRTLSTSIGLVDHPDEFFSPSLDWLALNTPQASVPARAGSYQTLFAPMARWRRRRPAKLARPAPTDPLEKVLEMARAAAPMTLPGTTGREMHLTPAPAHSADAVPLAPLPGIASQGQGPIPLQNPFLERFKQSPAMGLGLALGLRG